MFKISKHLEFEFLGGSKSLEPTMYRIKPPCEVLTNLDAKEKPIPNGL